MSAAPLERLKEIFHSARALPPPARERFVREACEGDEPLRLEVEALLEADHASDGFIADPPAQLAAEAFGDEQEFSEDAGRTIGQYKLIRRIGSGGMGAVYLAERADRQFQMQVAIKLIKRGMDTDSVLRRFAHERQILASLEHPNIARLLDGGTTAEGMPYFVMEHIRGERIDRYVEEHRLSISRRLELFCQVCGAVSYAHQHLVVHRDLKPSNILVTAEGVPKLLDFGIAKVTQPDGGADPFATMTAAPIMTPEYASPEQIEGAPATTLSDVYSLGAVLYQLLTGHPPFRVQSRTRWASEKISTRQTGKPSAGTTRAEEAGRLRGDLDNIVLMAMRPETARRYRSVEQFSEDIRRHLAGRPVIARADTLSYRSGKFLQRNALGVAAAALLLLTLLGGIVATAWQARRAMRQEQRARAEQARAERRFHEVRKLANSVLFDYHDAIKALPGATRVRERLVQDALAYLDSLAAEAHNDPALQRELAAAYERVGDVRGGISHGSLGDLSGGIQSYAKALQIHEALVAANPEDAQARRGLATSHYNIGNRLLETAEASKGCEQLRQALALRLQLAGEQPADEELQRELAAARNQLGHGMREQGDLVGALEQNRAALTIYEKLVASNPREQRFRRGLWASHDKISSVLFLQGDVSGALEAHGKARAVLATLLAEDPINGDYRGLMAVTCQHGGDILERSDKRAALGLFREAAALSEALLAADPINALTRKDLAYTHKRIADILVDLDEHSQALLHYSNARESYEKVVADASADLMSRFLVAICHAGMARMQARLGAVGPAHEECGRAIALLAEISDDKPGFLGRAEGHEYLGHAYAALAESEAASPAEARQRWNDAREMFRQAANILDERRRQGDLVSNEKYAKEVADEIAKCDAALRR